MLFMALSNSVLFIPFKCSSLSDRVHKPLSLSPSGGPVALSPSGGPVTLSPSSGSVTLSPSGGSVTLSLSSGSHAAS